MRMKRSNVACATQAQPSRRTLQVLHVAVWQPLAPQVG